MPQHSFSLCIAAGSFCSHGQTPNAPGKPGTPVLEHLRTESCLLTEEFLQHLATDGDGLGLCDFFRVETGNAQHSPLAMLDDRTERSKTFLKFGSPKLSEAGHILGIICIHLQTK